MEGLELISFEIISNVGMSKSLSIEAIREARNSRRKGGFFTNTNACRRSNDECRNYKKFSRRNDRNV